MAESYFSLREAAKYLRKKFPKERTPSYETIRWYIKNGDLAAGELIQNTRMGYVIPQSALETWFLERIAKLAKLLKEKDGKAQSRKARQQPERSR